jgi:hypothetical protein
MKKAAVLLAGALAVSALPAWASDWHDQTNYPARATAFTFIAGGLDSNHSVRFGSWTVSFDPQRLPLMQAFGAGDNLYYAPVNTANDTLALLCSNAVVGQARCTFWLNPAKPNKPNDWCGLVIMGVGQPLTIPCPRNITFQR